MTMSERTNQEAALPGQKALAGADGSPPQPGESGTPPGDVDGGSGAHPNENGLLTRIVAKFSNPASQVTGRLVSLVGLLLIVATIILGVIHALVPVDFAAAVTAGAALSIGGAFALQADYVRSWRVARDAIKDSQESVLREAKLRYLNEHGPR